MTTDIRAAFGGITIGDMKVPPFALRFDTESSIWRALRANRIWERHLTVYLAAAFGTGRTFFDVGANVGYYSVMAARIAPQARVVAFEPQAEIAAALRDNLIAAGCDGVQVIEAAVTAERGAVTLHPDVGLTEAAFVGDRSGGPTPAVTLDEFCAGAGLMPGIIKTDIQGLDLEALWGGRRMIAEARPLIVSEFAPGLLSRASVDMRTVFSFLAQHGYRPAFFRGHTHCAVEVLDFDLLAAIGDLWIRERPGAHMDVAFLPPQGG